MDFDSKAEVLSDFKKALEKIDFEKGYNPESVDFDRALKLGSMWRLLCKLEKKAEPMKEEVKHDRSDDMSEVIYLAKRYLQKRIDTGDTVYNDMASDMVRHGYMLLKKANAKLPSGDEKAKLKAYEIELQEIQKQIE